MVHQDKTVTLEVLYKIVEGLEKKYLVEENDREKKKIVDTVVFVLCIFSSGSRGEEILRVVLEESRYFLEGGETHRNHNHVVLLLRGIFKGENGEGYHLVVVVTAWTNSEL